MFKPFEAQEFGPKFEFNDWLHTWKSILLRHALGCSLIKLQGKLKGAHRTEQIGEQLRINAKLHYNCMM